MKKKSYLTIDQQIELLKSKNLLFKSEKKARNLLISIGYYKLINAYKIPFVIAEKDKNVFMSNVYFEDIYELYEFDRKLKTIVFEATTNIEINFKSLLSNLISEKYGIKENLYLKPENFAEDKGEVGEYKFSDMKKHIKNEIKKQYDNKQPSIKWYKDNYKYIPFWVVVNVLTIGSVSRIYSKLKLSDQIAISKKYLLPNDYVASYIRHINLVRNICAHNDVLYRYKSINAIPQKISRVKRVYESMNIQKNLVTGRYSIGSNDFLSTMIILKLMLSQENYNLFKTQFNGLICKLEKKLSKENYDKIIKEMGLSKNWKNMTF